MDCVFSASSRPQLPTQLFPYTTLFRSADLGADLPDPAHSDDSHLDRLHRHAASFEQGTGTRAVAISQAKGRSEEHTSELLSRGHLVCRLLLEKKNSSMDCEISAGSGPE